MRLEPYEQLEIEVSQEQLGPVVELAGRRRGALMDMKYRDEGPVGPRVYKIPRGAARHPQQFLTNTRGQGVMNTIFAGLRPVRRRHRFAVSRVAHRVGGRAHHHVRPRAGAGARPVFIDAGVEVYVGMVVGEHIRDAISR